MKIWLAHKLHALAIGDSVKFVDINGVEANDSNPPVLIPDGVRFTRALRDSHIYRAMLKVYNDILLSFAQLDREEASKQIEALFSNQVSTELKVISLSNNTYTTTFTRTPLYVINAIAISPDLVNRYPIPIRYGSDISMRFNSRNVQLPDAYIEYSGILSDIILRDFKNETHGMQLGIRYLPYPKDPSLAIDGINVTINWNMNLDIEERFIPMVLSYAKLFALSESQDIENMLALQLELGGK